MPKNNSKARRAERKAIADQNAAAVQINCIRCASRHRDSRVCTSNEKAF